MELLSVKMELFNKTRINKEVSGSSGPDSWALKQSLTILGLLLDA